MRLAMLEDDFVDHAVFLGLFGIHDEIPFDVFFDAFHRLATVLREKFVDHGAHAKNFLGMQVDIGGLAAETGEPWLVNKDAGIGQRKTLLGCATGEQDSGDGGSLSDASGDHVWFHELHGVVNGEPGCDGAARRIDIELDIAFGIFRLQKEHLSGGQISNMIVDRRADKDDVLFQQPRVNVVSALAAAGLLHDHRYKGGRLIGWIVVEIFHLIKLAPFRIPTLVLSIPLR